MRYARPNQAGSKASFRDRYDNYIGGEFVKPKKEKYFENISPVTGKPFCEVARSRAEDIELALDAAHGAKDAWGKTPVAERAAALHRIADVMEENLEMLAVAETWDNGKPIRETLAADIPLAIDHFRYFAGAIRAEDSGMAELDENTVSYHVKEPLGVVGQIIPWNFPILMAAWKLAPALAAGNAVVLKPAEQTPASIMLWAELINGILPNGRAQHRQRLRGGGGQAARPEPARGQGGVHRRDHHRAADHAVRLGEHRPGDPGARRQVAQRVLRRRLRRERRLP